MPWNPLVLLCWDVYTSSTWGSYHLRLLNLIWGRSVLQHLKIIALTDTGANATEAEAKAWGLSLYSGVSELKPDKNGMPHDGVVCVHVPGTRKSDLTLHYYRKGLLCFSLLFSTCSCVLCSHFVVVLMLIWSLSESAHTLHIFEMGSLALYFTSLA